MSKELLAIIPARGGSKGIPRKNVKKLSGKPLIAWTIEAAKKSKSIDRIIVSTDDNEIAEISKKYGAEVPFLRPRELAEDSTPSIDVMLHALDSIGDYPLVMMLQPTSPLRNNEDIDNFCSFFNSSKAISAVSVCEATKNPYWMYSLDEEKRMQPVMNGPLIPRRQELPLTFVLNGAIYMSNISSLRTEKNFIHGKTKGFVMSEIKSIDIDSPLDWNIAEVLIKETL